MEHTSFNIELEAVGTVTAAPSKLRRARDRAWKAISARLTKSLILEELTALGTLVLGGDATQVIVQWVARPTGVDPRHLIELAAAMEAPAIAKAFAPLGLRPRSLRTVYESLEPSSAAGQCGLCNDARSEPMRWESVRPEALDALRSLTTAALRATPDVVAATLKELLAAPEREVAVAATDALARLVQKARSAERVALCPAVAAAWRHPDAHIARSAFRCASSLGAETTKEVIDAWVEAVGRFGEDADTLCALSAFCRVAAPSGAFAAVLPVWLRSKSADARRHACAQLGGLCGAPLQTWSPGCDKAFDVLTNAAAEKIEAEYVPLLLRYFDRYEVAYLRLRDVRPAVVAWLDANDFNVYDVARDLLAQQPSYPKLDSACARMLRHPSAECRAFAIKQRYWDGYNDGSLSPAVRVLLLAEAESDGTPIGDELRARLEQMMIRNLSFPQPKTGRLLVARLLAPGTSVDRLDAIAERLLGYWIHGLHDEKLRVVTGFVEHGHTGALRRAFRTFVTRHADDEGGALVAEVGMGLSRSMQRAGAWAEGGEVAGVAAEVAPQSLKPDLLYNQACGCAMTSDAEGAARLLAEAVALDPKQADDARADADFAAVRGHPALVALLGPPA